MQVWNSCNDCKNITKLIFWRLWKFQQRSLHDGGTVFSVAEVEWEWLILNNSAIVVHIALLYFQLIERRKNLQNIYQYWFPFEGASLHMYSWRAWWNSTPARSLPFTDQLRSGISFGQVCKFCVVFRWTFFHC